MAVPVNPGMFSCWLKVYVLNFSVTFTDEQRILPTWLDAECFLIWVNSFQSHGASYSGVSVEKNVERYSCIM